MAVEAIGISWYKPEDYDRMKRMFKDGWKLPDTYEEWLAEAEKAAAQLTAQGFVVVRSPLDPKAFPEWCRARGLEMTGETRSVYSAEYAGNNYFGKVH
jgi:hypothetical protein